MRPTTALPLVTTREPTFFACSQLVALLTLASGAIVATSAPFCLRMLSMDIDIASSNRMASLPISSRPAIGGHTMESVLSTRSISISYRQEAVSEHRGPRNPSVVGQLVRDQFG